MLSSNYNSCSLRLVVRNRAVAPDPVVQSLPSRLPPLRHTRRCPSRLRHLLQSVRHSHRFRPSLDVSFEARCRSPSPRVVEISVILIEGILELWKVRDAVQ